MVCRNLATGRLSSLSNQGKATCKRLRYLANGRPYLKAENPHYEDRTIAEGDEFEIWGVVRYALHKLV